MKAAAFPDYWLVTGKGRPLVEQEEEKGSSEATQDILAPVQSSDAECGEVHPGSRQNPPARLRRYQIAGSSRRTVWRKTYLSAILTQIFPHQAKKRFSTSFFAQPPVVEGKSPVRYNILRPA